MDQFTTEEFSALVRRVPDGDCVSIYLPTRPGSDEVATKTFRHCLEEAERQLLARGSLRRDTQSILAKARAVLDDNLFWRQLGRGMACFASEGWFQCFRLQDTFAERVVVGTLPYVTPLLPAVQCDGQFFLLALSQNHARLFRGDRSSLSEVTVAGLPTNMSAALQAHDRDEALTYHTRPATGRGRQEATFHGQGVGIDDKKEDLLAYFRLVDRAVDTVLNAHQYPLVLATVGYLEPIYRRATSYSRIVPDFVAGNPDHVDLHELHEKSWAAVKSQFEESMLNAGRQYHQMIGTGRTTNSIAEIVEASAHGEIATLFVDTEGYWWGHVHPSGHVDVHRVREAGDEELINLAVLRTLRHRNDVYALSDEQMLAPTGIAATYHLPMAKHGKRR